MKFFLGILLCSISFLNINAQSNIINKTDEQGLKQGKWKKLYRHGVTAYEGQFINDIEYGTFNYYYDDGSNE